jgi:hypothetical protein
MIEGSALAPDLSPIADLPLNLLAQSTVSVITAWAIVRLFPPDRGIQLRQRVLATIARPFALKVTAWPERTS